MKSGAQTSGGDRRALLDSFPRLLHLPFKRVAALVAVLFFVGEFYPLSNFPMYSGIAKDADYYFLTDGDDSPIPMLERFGIRTARAKKIFQMHLNEITRARGGKRSTATAEELERAALLLLEALFANMPDGQAPLLTAQQLRLYRVDLTLEDGRFHRQRHLMAEFPASRFLAK